MGITGSALATTIGEICSFVYLVRYYAKGKSLIKLDLSSFKPQLKVLRQIVGIGFAPFLAQISACLMIGLSNKVAASYGTAALGIMGIIYVIYPFALQPLIGIAGGAQPIIGYNYGAGNYGRVKKTLFAAVLLGTILCVSVWFVVFNFALQIVGFFTPDTLFRTVGAKSLKIFFACIPFAGIQMIGSCYFLAVGKAGISFFNNLLRQLILIVPLILLLPRFMGFDGICYSNPISDTISAVIVVAFLTVEFRNLKSIETARPETGL